MQFVRLEPDQAPNEGGSVFSSSGDIIRKGVPPPEEAKFGRSTGHGAKKLLRTAASGAALIAEGSLPRSSLPIAASAALLL